MLLIEPGKQGEFRGDIELQSGARALFVQGP